MRVCLLVLVLFIFDTIVNALTTLTQALFNKLYAVRLLSAKANDCPIIICFSYIVQSYYKVAGNLNSTQNFLVCNLFSLVHALSNRLVLNAEVVCVVDETFVSFANLNSTQNKAYVTLQSIDRRIKNLQGGPILNLLVVLLFFIPMVEAVTVIIQVTSKKLRNGKKIFLSTPIHHHFEAIGWPESQITMRFWIISVVATGLALAIFFIDGFI